MSPELVLFQDFHPSVLLFLLRGRKTKVKFVGHTLIAKGLEPELIKVFAKLAMKPPTYKSEPKTLLGMVTYVAKFAPNLSEITSGTENSKSRPKRSNRSKPPTKTFLSYFDPKRSQPYRLTCSSMASVPLLCKATCTLLLHQSHWILQRSITPRLRKKYMALFLGVNTFTSTFRAVKAL